MEGAWRLPQGELTFTQNFQVLSGSLSSGGSATPIVNGRLRGDQITFSHGGADYTGRVNGDAIEGVVTAGGRSSNWTATRSR
jgi:hypothetical protein